MVYLGGFKSQESPEIVQIFHPSKNSLQISGRSRIRRFVFEIYSTVVLTTQIRSVPDDNKFGTKMIVTDERDFWITRCILGYI